MKRYLSDAKQRLTQTELRTSPCPTAPEMRLVKVYPQVERQHVVGFGAALTEASGYVYSQMDDATRKRFIELCFGADGNGYSLARTAIGSCDFSLGPRAYVNSRADKFSIEDDYAFVIPLALGAARANPALELIATPWSPPAWMKTNRSMKRGGRLRERYLADWAHVIAEYIAEYRKLGLHVTRVTAQNEPAATQSWESCRFTAAQERTFICSYLKPALAAAGLDDVKVLGWDHNKESVLERACQLLGDEGEATLDGIAFHWYSGDHFEALRCVREVIGPDRELIFTEGCSAYSRGRKSRELGQAEHYAHEIIGDLEAGANGIIDWNVLLNEKGGPNHVGNFCDAPIMYDTNAHELRVRLPFYYIGHFSRFIQPGSKRLLCTRFTVDLETRAFANPDGTYVLVALNRTNRKISFKLTWGLSATTRRVVDLDAPAHSIQTLVW